MATRVSARLFAGVCGVAAVTATLYGFTHRASAADAKRHRQTIPAVEGNVTVNEASGAVLMEGISGPGHTVLLEGNEKIPAPGGGTEKVLDVQMVRNADAPFAQKVVDAHSEHLVLPNLSVDDIEDVAWDPARRAAFFIGSHSRNKDNEIRPNRRKMARLLFDANGTLIKAEETDALENALRHTFAFIPHALDTASQEVGGKKGTLNIEGVVFIPGGSTNPGKLLLGLRSPTAQGGLAQVLVLKNPHALFDSPGTSPQFAPQPLTLPLGKQGIRGMTYDSERNGCWILAGRSAHDGINDPWTLWFWKPGAGNPVLQHVPPLAMGAPMGTPEGICCLTLAGKPALLLVEDRNETRSRYALIPKPPR